MFDWTLAVATLEANLARFLADVDCKPSRFLTESFLTAGGLLPGAALLLFAPGAVPLVLISCLRSFIGWVSHSFQAPVTHRVCLASQLIVIHLPGMRRKPSPLFTRKETSLILGEGENLPHGVSPKIMILWRTVKSDTLHAFPRNRLK